MFFQVMVNFYKRGEKNKGIQHEMARFPSSRGLCPCFILPTILTQLDLSTQIFSLIHFCFPSALC